MWRSSLWSISWLRHQMFYSYIMISPPRPTKWRPTPRDVTILSLSFCFFGHTKNHGICEATKDRSHASSKKREIGGAFKLGQSSHGVIGLHMLLRRLQTLNWATAHTVRNRFRMKVRATWVLYPASFKPSQKGVATPWLAGRGTPRAASTPPSAPCTQVIWITCNQSRGIFKLHPKQRKIASLKQWDCCNIFGFHHSWETFEVAIKPNFNDLH